MSLKDFHRKWVFYHILRIFYKHSRESNIFIIGALFSSMIHGSNLLLSCWSIVGMNGKDKRFTTSSTFQKKPGGGRIFADVDVVVDVTCPFAILLFEGSL